MTLTIIKKKCTLPEINFDNPNGLNKGSYLAKCSEDILFQLPILKSKNRWPYKTIKPDAGGPPLSKAEKSLLERRKQKNKNDLKS